MTATRMTSANRLGVGIVGLGSIGVTHAQALAAIAEAGDQPVSLVAYSGGNPGKAAEAGWPDAEQLSVDAVIKHPGISVIAVAGPSQVHGELTIAALEAGKHVLVEKPLTLLVGEAERIRRLAREQGRIVRMVAQRHYETEYAHVKQLIDAGDLGALRLAATQVHWWRDDDYYTAAAWRGSMAAGGGSVMNQGVHNIDLLRWLAGPVARVTAQYATLGHAIDAEDTTVATLSFRSGALGMISISTATPPGTPATVTLQFASGGIELGQGEVIRWDVPAARPAAGEEVRSGAADPANIGIAGHVTQWRQLIDALGSDPHEQPDLDDAVATVRLLCAIYAAAESGRAVNPDELS
ncbi:Gfo/Idh/MocA family protein [Microlunatus parietis]|uniref:Putative dehydrogenase n=1 Tax=Microlunatus parietis TaxID=682979 RepID=A0A7Y9I416_9ACTN|nr:Gfo/Idh/MocA family oxidoreductase [Microlunatus parietis]NYE69847.1 putative dehydrogenase [Microlunatus parietis]